MTLFPFRISTMIVLRKAGVSWGEDSDVVAEVAKVETLVVVVGGEPVVEPRCNRV